MSTRANVKINGGYGEGLWFYRHSDGYPDGALPTLKKFMRWVKDGKIRNNASQASGWLIMIGATEYDEIFSYENGKFDTKKKTSKQIFEPIEDDRMSGWKVGSYEPTDDQHGDIEYLYTLDLEKLTIHVKDMYDSDRSYTINKDEF